MQLKKTMNILLTLLTLFLYFTAVAICVGVLLPLLAHAQKVGRIGGCDLVRQYEVPLLMVTAMALLMPISERISRYLPGSSIVQFRPLPDRS